MKKIFRDKTNNDYWEERWAKSGVDKDEFEDENIYPIKYANLAIKKGDKILEAGCGAGRVYFHYKKRGFNIKGIDFSKSGIKNILDKDKSADVEVANISQVQYPNENFDLILAFGLYHNIEDINELKKSFKETVRILKKKGQLVASVRFDSLENNIIENIVKKRSDKNFNKFHRWHFSLNDMKNLLGTEIEIKKVYYARNVSFLFKFDYFRTKILKSSNFSESIARSTGFKLNWIGTILDNFLHFFFPRFFSNLLVILAEKKQ